MTDHPKGLSAEFANGLALQVMYIFQELVTHKVSHNDWHASSLMIKIQNENLIPTLFVIDFGASRIEGTFINPQSINHAKDLGKIHVDRTSDEEALNYNLMWLFLSCHTEYHALYNNSIKSFDDVIAMFKYMCTRNEKDGQHERMLYERYITWMKSITDLNVNGRELVDGMKEYIANKKAVI